MLKKPLRHIIFPSFLLLCRSLLVKGAEKIQVPPPLTLPPEQPSCLSLNQSVFCGGSYGRYYISSKALVSNSPVTDIQAFDRALGYYFGSPTDITQINAAFNCSAGIGWDGVYEPPYRVSFTCRALLNNNYTDVCNAANPIPPLCQSTCLSYIDGWSTVIKNQTICPATPQEMNIKLQNLQTWCDSFPFTGAESNCISGPVDQDNTCGFILPLQSASLCTFCSFSNAKCCQSESALACPGSSSWRTKPGISTAALVCSIVFSCLGGIGLIIGLIFFFKRRRLSYGNSNKTTSQNMQVSIPNTADSTARLNITIPSVCEYVCEFPYRPALPDELALEVDDVIVIVWTFDDGWAVGRNLSRGGEGAFPMACVTVKQVDNVEYTGATPQTGGIPRRTSSKRTSNRPKSLS
ncbi:hypothetical protein K493DRAFT_337417 [Basidiobolus meristosporus CBS 931.73]|uniref:SH3 domain-containing protein n=1 Tax=Basidiobolus meristosporus CBS 931.73 TaxID=1314790 RepID=A0A1Y1YBE2_9FUNG|nr:hypothetical protein K493DRAFT_337417 [Basidiobolus meristosporus CBS 931.73]|eukprot:ORX95263.1 hypothetical protein K493DRAFT_337417 [Basidiobolus meristosporus CBS 931.73]